MKKVLFLVAAVVAANFVWAQNDAKAKEILDQVSEKAKTFKTMSAGFVFSMVNEEMDINEKNEGTIKVKGKMYSVKLPEAGVEVYSDGTTLWNYMKEGNQVTVTNVEDEGNDLMTPSSIFNIYEKGFKSSFKAEKKEGAKTIYEIQLFPDTDEHGVSEITVLIDKASNMLHAAHLLGVEGNTYSIEVKNLETDKDFADSEFIFNKSNYPDVEEIDFR